MGANDPRGGAIFDPGAWLARFIKRTTIHCYIQNMKALGLVVSEKKFLLCLSHDAPGVGPVWTLGAWLAGFIKRITILCYTLYCALWFRRRFFICFSLVSLWELMILGRGYFLPQGHGWQNL